MVWLQNSYSVHIALVNVCDSCCIVYFKQIPDCTSTADKLKAAGHDVELSKSAGRYLCNYIYFRSLLNCTSIPNWHALFVHLPPLKFIGEEQQLALALDLFDALRADFQPQQVESIQKKVAVTA